MEVRRGLVYPHQTMLDDIEINTSSYAVVKVDLVHENSNVLKLEVPPDDTTLTMRDAVTRRVQWRWTSIDVDPSGAASASTTPSQPNTSPASIFPETRMSLSPNLEQLHMSPI
jgi:YbbR domain-containing protein